MSEEEFAPQDYSVVRELILQLLEGKDVKESFVLRHPFDGLASGNNRADVFCDLNLIKDLFKDLNKNLYLLPDSVIQWLLLLNDSMLVEEKQDYLKELVVEVFST